MPCWTWAVPKDAPTLKHGGDLEMVVKREHMLGWLANLGSRINERRSQDRKTTHLDPVKLKITFNSNDLKRKVWCEHYGEPSPVLLAEVLRDGRTLYVKAPRPGPKEEKDLEESAIQTGEIVRTKAYLSFVD